MSEYLTTVLDWLDANWITRNIERWFFFKTWKNIVNIDPDSYMGIIFFDDAARGASLTCLGDVYRARSQGGSAVVCDAAGATVPAP